ncbi:MULTISPECIES: M3 family metallopeptidase [Empedobacter]|uniref:M3 family metallopeptidase n=1 Tax=Empedobacter falsenii TaxID=343874 RepID=A0A7H9DV77_9FLAO|nr:MULTISPECIES: M3 family metallopeptidase [Empedobacter]MDH2208552.1 M3 family metallopeptidase [Empedobacter sp. GD03644]QLL58621.1 M3 family metallopeptidase [Empedobacter falsenii]
MANPLLEKFETPFESAPFSKIKNEDYKPAFIQAIEEAKAEIDAITANPEAPTFANTIEAMELSGEKLGRISSIFFNLNSAETNDEIQEIAQEVSPLLSEFGNDVRLNQDLFERIKVVYNQKDSLNLTDEQAYLLEKKYKGFSRNGANLNEEDKNKLREIDKQLSMLSLQFGQNVLAETNAYELIITDENDLKGLPQYAIDQAKADAEQKNHEGWLITLQAPSYIPFMQYAENRELREKLFRANGVKAYQNNEFNNEENVKNIVKLRHERAKILGYKTHADYVLEERMAKTPTTVLDFLNDLLTKAKPFAEKEIKELTAFAKETDGIETLQRWDHAYYAEKLKQKKFSLSDEELKPYFQLENVIEGAFDVATKLYGITFKEIHNIDKYNDEVTTYEVLDKNGAFLSLLYADFFPRAGKRPGAWMTSYREASNVNGNTKRPHVSIVCNFTKPTKDTPSLLTFQEVTTLFHEFGHALHGMLPNTTYESLSGTNVYWDFVELPSQFYENFCYEPEALKLFAKHYQTGEIIPQELIEKVKASSSFMEGYQTVRQLSFGLLDMAYHANDLAEINDLQQFEKETFKQTELYPEIDKNMMSTSFSHIFQGGYSSGYYSYKWAEVLDADAFAFFQETGIFNPATAQKFYKLLSSGGTVEPMKLYEEFRGHKPTADALLKRAGLI